MFTPVHPNVEIILSSDGHLVVGLERLPFNNRTRPTVCNAFGVSKAIMIVDHNSPRLVLIANRLTGHDRVASKDTSTIYKINVHLTLDLYFDQS